MVPQPETHYVKGPEGNIAYQVFGDAPIDLAPGLPLAEAGEVLVSSTVKDLVNDSGIAFQERAPTCSRAYPGSGSCSRRQATWRPSLTTFRSS